MNKDEMIISKEAYYEALNAAQESGQRMGYAKGRDETASKILKEIYAICKEEIFLEFSDLEKLANKYGVDLEEEN